MNGVVHVGGHKGEEIPAYRIEGRSPIIIFEPQCLPVEEDLTGVRWVTVALSCAEGTRKLRIPRHLTPEEGLDTQSASLLELIPERAIANGWTPTSVEIITVPVMPFRTWACSSEFESGSCTLLRIDVQGHELEVLAGFGSYLGQFEEIVVECSHPPLYKGGADAYDIDRYLSIRGFVRRTPMLRHGDLRFTR